MMISTRRFCGSRTSGPVGAGGAFAEARWCSHSARTPSVISCASTAFGASDRQSLVNRRARGIGIAVHLDPGYCTLAELAAASAMIWRARYLSCTYPNQEHQIGSRLRCCWHWRGGRRWRWRLAKVVAQPIITE